MAIAVSISVVLISKWSLASWLGAKSERNQTWNRLVPHSIRPEMLFGDSDSAIGQMVQGGVWSVGDSIWNFENQSVDAQQLASELQFADNSVNGIESDQPEHIILLDLVPAERAVVERVGERTVRSIDYGNVKSSVCYREVEGHRFFIGAKVANQEQDDKHWQVISLTPRRMVSPARKHLLPIAGEIITACQRLSKSGSLQCEIVETDRPLAELLDGWWSSGWKVEPFSSDDLQLNSAWGCIQGESHVHVRATSNLDQSKVTLVLTALHNL